METRTVTGYTSSSSHSRLNDLFVSLLAGTDLRPPPASYPPVNTLGGIGAVSLGFIVLSKL